MSPLVSTWLQHICQIVLLLAAVAIAVHEFRRDPTDRDFDSGEFIGGCLAVIIMLILILAAAIWFFAQMLNQFI